jgi:DNA-binding winged helix-turn-helix (wHTH) protein
LKARYRFGAFTVSPSRRLLLHAGQEVPLIPRYFDLLVLLVERRGEAVHRRQIRDAVWSDVVVSDGALSQAVRTLRRALGDDSREPSFIRTLSRHGYRFVYEDVVEEPDEAAVLPSTASAETGAGGAAGLSAPDAWERLLARLLAPDPDNATEDDRRSAAEELHALGTAEALRRLDRRPGQARGRALMRDARWDVPGAAAVPLLGSPDWPVAVASLVRLRLRRAARLIAARWTAACAGGAVAGVVGGLMGSIVLLRAPGSTAPLTLPVGLAVVGAIVGGVGAAGVGAGMVAAEALARSARGAALVILGSLAGGATGALASAAAHLTLADLFGQTLPSVGGGLEGLVLGGACGAGYALATPRPAGGMATPHGLGRLRAALVTALVCAAAGLVLTLAGGQLTGASLNALARSFHGSQLTLEPLARLLGEKELGPVTRGVLAVGESALFACGLVLGLTRRPR